MNKKGGSYYNSKIATCLPTTNLKTKSRKKKRSMKNKGVEDQEKIRKGETINVGVGKLI